MTAPHDFAAQGRLLADATPGPWRVEASHDLWREVRHGYGSQNRMVVDCAMREDGPLIASMRNTIDDLRAVVKWAWEVHNDCCLSLESSCSPDVYAGFVAALARFSNVGEVRS